MSKEKPEKRWELTPCQREEFRRRIKTALERRGEQFPRPLEDKVSKTKGVTCE